jgi:hypothetical protein
MTISSFAPQQQGPAPSEQWAKRLLGVCAVGCVVAVLAACGSSSPGSPSTSSNSPVSSSSSATSASAVTPASLSQLKKIALQPAELPSGWKWAPYQGGPDNSAINADLYKCVGARNTDSDKVAEAHSGDFTLGDADISSSAASYRSQSDLNTDIAMLHSPKISPCLEQMMKKQVAASLPAGGTIASVSVKTTPGSAGLANVVATGTGTITISVNGQQVTVYLTTAFITGPLIEAEVDTSNVGTPVPASVVNSLVATVATRAAKG